MTAARWIGFPFLTQKWLRIQGPILSSFDPEIARGSVIR